MLVHRLPLSGAYVGEAEHQHRLTGSKLTNQELALQMVSAVAAAKQHAAASVNRPMQRKVQARFRHRLLLSRAHVAGLSASIWRQGSACGRQNAMRHHFSFEIAYSALASSTPATTSATKLSNLRTQRTLIQAWSDCLVGQREPSLSLQSKQALLLLQRLLSIACVVKSMRLACMLRNVVGGLHSTALSGALGTCMNNLQPGSAPPERGVAGMQNRGQQDGNREHRHRARRHRILPQRFRPQLLLCRPRIARLSILSSGPRVSRPLPGGAKRKKHDAIYSRKLGQVLPLEHQSCATT